jgi:hypothetical protein
MATYTDSLGFNKGTRGPSGDGRHESQRLMEVDLDFATIAAASCLLRGLRLLRAADVLEVLSASGEDLRLARWP